MEREKSSSRQPFDLTEEASRREDEKATTIARRVESDDVNEETNIGPVNEPTEDKVENRVATSLDEE
jgi:hypothetical protein